MLILHSAAHLLVDALCASALFGPLGENPDLSVLILLYNTLAFSTQCFVGMAADSAKKHVPAASLSMLFVVFGFILPVPAVLRVALIGIGNSVFHVAGGAFTLERSGGRAGVLGVFVAPGAIGLTLGTLRPSLGPVFAVLLTLTAAAEIPLSRILPAPPEKEEAPYEKPEAKKEPLAAVLLLTAAVAIRAIGGSVVSFPWKTTALLTLTLTLFVWAGKTAGGFLCDRIGAKYAALLSVPAAAVLIAFFSARMIPSLAGQFALNLTMPVTLCLLYRAMPDSPGFAFGLAASALWPGTIAGKFITLTGPAAQALTVAAVFFGLFAIVRSARIIRKSECSKKGDTP